MSLDRSSSPSRASRPARGTSLRSRWTRAFGLLTALVVLSGVSSFLGTRLLVDIFQGSAVQVERQASTGARLRSEVVVQSLLISGQVSPAQQRQVAAAQVKIDAGFTEALAAEEAPRARRLLERSQDQWTAVVTASGPSGAPADLATRGAAVSLHAPKVLTLLDQAGVASRDAVRADLASARSAERGTMAILALLQLLTILLAVRLSRRLSIDVIRPVGILRDSANHLANGELDHRVRVDRDDELGDLAVSFNAMADAIAGSQRSLTREATTDSLTGLANRAAFRAQLAASLGRPERRRGNQAVLFVDLDDFKDVNDTLGHAAGDGLLREVAARLVETVRPGDLVARLGGDEFAVLLDGLAEPDLAGLVAQRVVTAVALPFAIGEHSVQVGASVGLALRDETSTLEGLMREADVAMYAAKGRGKNRVERYDAELDDAAAVRQMLRTDLGTAAERGELVLDYQPMVDLRTGRLVGAEALVRWQHPTRGLLPPSEFIEAAEETGAIVGIGAFVLETATRRLAGWQRDYQRPDLWLSVNVSVCQLDLPGFPDHLADILSNAGVDPARLVLEVTETVLANPGGGAAASLSAARRTGVRVALDDFGTGYSSIGYLRQLPVDILKIDRSFLSGTHAGDPGDELLEAIMAMATSLGLDIIPEGIERVEQLNRLQAMGCTVGQGFFLARPVTDRAIGDLLAATTPFAHVGPGGLALPVAGRSASPASPSRPEPAGHGRSRRIVLR
jgi:diguanylate cyclase (GGDEF)-like protein